MSAAIAMAPSPAPHDRAYIDMSSAPSKSPPSMRGTASATPNAAAVATAHRTGSGSPSAPGSSGKGSPNLSRNGVPPKIIVKKEPSSPDLPTSRHRPRKLDLSKGASSAGPSRPSGGQLTSRDTSGLGIQDVGLACLSPGFVTQDPTMREQLQRSISVREQQRHIIESRLQQSAKPGDAPLESAKEREMAGPGGMKTPATTRRKAPPGLSIVAPSHEQFANERVIQSAPLNQTFTGLRHSHPLSRHLQNQPSNLSNTSHIHHVPANQTANRLPPIADVFASEGLGQHRHEASRPAFGQSASASNSSHSNTRPAFPSSPGFPPQHASHQQPQTSRPREFRSAEEAQAELSGGRPELLPKIVHYGGHQPPTPPSPLTGNAMKPSQAGTRRRQRAEYEEGASPPLGSGPSSERRRMGPFGEGRDSEEDIRRKKDEFMSLCARAWDLFHS